MTRPGPLLWLRYALVGSLPAKYSEWVLHDVTVGTWLGRHLARVLVMVAVPELVVVLVIPASTAVRALTAFVTGACVLLLMAILAGDTVERIAQRAGYPWGTAQRLREERGVQTQRRQAAAYRERVARRRG
ncbi:DUF5313 family protein [uncultured Jatrophihabitans sp.]|uniref:DUF5313 family protein n=1 Tax=uncultured Jatrophihabitans sp. TaxID=1610747 RepID=UPI0035CB069C